MPRFRHILATVLAMTSAALALAAGSSLSRDRAVLDALAGQEASVKADGTMEGAADGARAAGWIEVAGTTVSYPVMEEGDSAPAGYWLTHDYTGAYSWMGTPYLDRRCDADGPHLLIYGHDLGLPDLMFTPLRTAWRQADFDRLGEVTWTPAGGEPVRLRPLCTLKVDASYAPVQAFGFAGAAELRSWLAAVAANAAARAGDLDARASSATRVVTLATCASPLAGETGRTLLVCAA